MDAESQARNPKLKTLNSKQTQMSKAQNLKPKKLSFELYILDLFRVWNLVFGVFGLLVVRLRDL